MSSELRIHLREVPDRRGVPTLELVAVTACRRIGRVSGRRIDHTTYLVEDLLVEPSHRGRGVGVMLLGALAETLLRRHATSLVAVADDRGSGRLIAWYSRLGFVRVGLDGEDRPLLVGSAGKIVAIAKLAATTVGSQLERP